MASKEDNGNDGVLSFLNTSTSFQGESLMISTNDWRGDLLLPGGRMREPMVGKS